MKILNFGSCNIDYVYSLDHIVKVGETETTYKMNIFPGGKGLNQSIAAAKAGITIYHAGCVGEDGDMLTSLMAESGVDTAFVKKTSGKNGHAIIQVSAKGENSIFLFPGSNEKVSKEYADEVLKNFGKGDILLLQNEISNVAYIVEKAYEIGMTIILNPSPINEKINEIDFEKLGYIILNEIEIAAIAGCDDPREGLAFIRRKYPKLRVVLTLGSDGSVYSDEKCELYQPAFKAEAVDTTAAGDTVTGYFVAGMMRDEEVKNILKTASAASAIAVSKEGAASSIPRIDFVSAKIGNMKESIKKKTETLLGQIDGYLNSNLTGASVEELAEILGYSAVYTGALVKKIKGMTFSKALQAKRCAAAADMLLNTEISVCEIAEKVGYENKSFFRKIFKEKYGKNPLEFRKTSSL